MGIKEDKKKPGTWSVSYHKRHPITRETISLKRIGIKSIAQAKRVHTELIVLVNRRIEEKIVPTWEVAVENYLLDLRERDLTERTVYNNKVTLEAHTFEAWREKLLTEISTSEIKALLKQRMVGRSPSQQQNLLKFIRGVFRCGVENDHIKVNPTPTLKFKQPDRAKQFLTEGQVHLFLTKAAQYGSEWYPHWVMAIYTGMRSGELYALTWDKVNLEESQIVVDSSWNNKDGFKGTKSGHDRIVPISPILLSVLKELRLRREGGDFVLPRLGKWSKGEQARQLQAFLIGIGLPPMRFHDLRATWATLLLSKGTEPAKVMRMGGWRDMKTMMIYLRMAGIDVKGATDCLELHNPLATPGKILELKAELS